MRSFSHSHRSCVIPSALALALCLAAPLLVAAQEQPRRGGTLIVALDGDPPGMNPGITTSIPTQLLGGQAYNTLIRLDHDLKVQPELAEKWDIARDGMTYTFFLRKDVKWHDGKPFTSADVKYSMLEISRKYNGIARQALDAVASLDTPDPYTVVFKMKYASPPFFPWSLTLALQMHILPKHIYEGTEPTKNEFNLKPVGTGPFVFKEYAKGTHITFERNPNYFKPGQPYLDRIVFKIVPDAAARVLALEKGEIDYLPYFGFPASSAKALMKLKDIEVLMDKRPAFGMITAFFNLRSGPLKVKEVRQAITHAVDRKVIVDKALDGFATPAAGPISSQAAVFFNSEMRSKREFDPAKANQLLDKAGFPKKADGTRFALRLSFQRGAEGGAIPSAGDIMREQLKAVGIDLTLQPMDYAAHQEITWKKWDFDLSLFSALTGPDPSSALRLYLTENIKPLVSHNLMGYSNPKVDALSKAGDLELDEAKRAAIYKEAQVLMVEEVPALWIWEKVYPIGWKRTVKGLPGGAAHFEALDDVYLTGGAGVASNVTALVVVGVVVLLAIGGGLLLVRRVRAA